MKQYDVLFSDDGEVVVNADSEINARYQAAYNYLRDVKGITIKSIWCDKVKCDRCGNDIERKATIECKSCGLVRCYECDLDHLADSTQRDCLKARVARTRVYSA